VTSQSIKERPLPRSEPRTGPGTEQLLLLEREVEDRIGSWQPDTGRRKTLELFDAIVVCLIYLRHNTIQAALGEHLTSERVAKKPEGLDLAALLDVIEAEVRDAPDLLQWAMNHCQTQIGIDHPEYRARAMDIGERLEVLKDYSTPRTARPPTGPSGSPRSSGAARPVGGAWTWIRAGPEPNWGCRPTRR